MYVHIGGTCTISDRLILGIFALDATTTGRKGASTRAFLNRMEADNRLMVLSPDLPKSFVVTLEGVYLSPVSVVTLRQRLERRTFDETMGFEDIERDLNESERS